MQKRIMVIKTPLAVIGPFSGVTGTSVSPRHLPHFQVGEEFLEFPGADSLNIYDIFLLPERPMVSPEVHDSLGRGLPDPWQLHKLIHAGSVDIDAFFCR